MAVKKTEGVKPINVSGLGPEWEESEEVMIPRGPKGAPKTVFVSINGKAFYVPRGKAVMVPKPIAERVNIMKAAMEDEQDMLEDMASAESLT